MGGCAENPKQSMMQEEENVPLTVSTAPECLHSQQILI